MKKDTETAVVLISKYTRYDPANPQKTAAHDFLFVGLEHLDEGGSLKETWANDGYVFVGHAKIEIEFLPQKDVTASAVASLKKQKKKVLADAQAKATEIEQQIQSLLAITFDA